ncbi:MAG: proton-conducting transporter membrane subunit [Actinomycetota bacterium]|nr:proton-conducting transporter membrane subunit [Actinomycetota bacterium]
MAALLIAPLAICLLLVMATAVARKSWLNRFAGIIAAAAVLASGVVIAALVLAGGPLTAIDGLLRADALTAFMLTVVGAVGLTATWGSLAARGTTEHKAFAYPTLIAAFLFAMSLAVLADNLGILWVALEATTITTAFLVGYHRTRNSLEAAWKYVVLGSVGVAIALLGIVLLYAATVQAGHPTLSWTVLTNAGITLDPGLVKMAAGLTLLGFATKAGLAPMHSWLPDAHSQAPAAVSGLMSGVLLSVAFYGILRVQAITDAVIGPDLMRNLLIAGGLLSIAEAAALILRQRDLKRMLAYSSIEHMGIIALAAAIGGPLAIGAALLHMLGHGLAKSSIFVVSGRILTVDGSTQISQIRSLLTRRSGIAIPFLAAMAALLGMPPFALFFTEVAIVVAGFQRGLGWVMSVAIALLLIAFIGLARHTSDMMFGTDPDPEARQGHAPQTGDRSAHGPRLPLIAALAATAIIGFLTGPFSSLLSEAANVLGGGR